jgi:polyisoprenoid-binding protein YceI
MVASARSPKMRPLALAGMIALFALAALCLPARAALETFQIDPAHSSAGFKVRHLFTQVEGRFKDIAGTLTYDAAKPENSHIEITIQAASISTDNDMRDNHLRSADFFDAAQYPTITFKSTMIMPTDQKGRYQVTGDFTMHGVTRPVVVTVDLLGFAEVTGMGYRGGFAATTTINRQDFGLKWNKVLDNGGTLVGDQVQIDFPIEVVRQGS